MGKREVRGGGGGGSRYLEINDVDLNFGIK